MQLDHLLFTTSAKKMDLVAIFLSFLSIMGYPGVSSSGGSSSTSSSSSSASSEDIQRHLEMGQLHLQNRQFTDALTHFHAAIEGNPNNYQVYYKRALVYLALGKYNQAQKDLDKVIELKEDFTLAVVQRANLLLKQGRVEDAHVDYERVLRREPDNFEAVQGYQSAEEMRQLLHEARYFVEIQDCHAAVDLLTKIIEVSPWDSEMRRMRSDCYMTLGDATHAIMDLRFTTKLNNDDTDGLYRLSSLQYQLGEVEDALREIRECLKLDPEHKHCFPLYKKLKKLDKLMQDANQAVERQDYAECVDDINRALKVDNNVPQMVDWKLRHKLCTCHMKNGEGSLAVEQCSKALELREDPDLLCDRAEAYLLNDLFSEAMSDYRRALDLDEDNRRAKEGMQRVQKLEKQASKRDYYKILGVKRSANKQEITKAYRKAAQKWHPDNYPDSDEKKLAEKKFIDIAAAKEVLTDPEKRAKFDQGEDPLDAEQQHGGGGGQGFNPFQHFHFHQGGGPQFSFKFN